MRRLYLLLLIFFVVANDSFSQQPLHRVSKSYFRSDPFTTSFSSFLQHLINDPSLINKKIERRTDSTYFSFEGTYSQFNPFFSKPDSVNVVLTEFATGVNDSLQSDTIYSYQLIAFYNQDKNGEKEIKKEFERIHKRVKSDFAGVSADEGGEGQGTHSYNYFIPYHLLAPFSLGWYKHEESKQLYLVLTLRLKPIANETRVPYFMLEER